MESLSLSVRKLHAHLAKFFDTHAVFPGNRATVINAKLQDLAAQFFRTLKLSCFVGIVQNQGVQVAIAGMEYICHGQAVAGRQLSNP